MALSDSEQQQQKRSVTRRAVNATTNKHWSDSQKLEAVQTYLILGSVRMTAAALKIPEVTLGLWRSKTWWKDLETDLKTQDELQLSARLQRIAAKSFEVVEDRLVHGNHVFDQKTGKLIRVPVNLKDAHKVAIDSIVQRDTIGKKHVDTANDGQIADKLLALANKFAEIANQQYDKNRTFDVDIEDVESVSQTDMIDEEGVSPSTNTEGENYGLSGNSVRRDAGREEVEEELRDLRN